MFLIAVVAAAVAALAFALGGGPVGVVLPADTIALAFSVGAATAVAAYRLRRRSWSRATVIVGVLSLLLMAASAWRGFLSYRQEEISFRNGDVRLSGTLLLPRGSRPHAAVVIVHGSGRESRREYVFYGKVFARSGIAALAYDKRGAGKSTGHTYGTDYAGYASDALAGLAAIGRHARVDSTRMGLFGISEAEWVAPLAAAASRRVSFLVITSAAGTSPAEQVNAEIALRLRAAGYNDSIVARARAVNDSVFAYQRSGAGADSLRVLLTRAAAEPWFAAAEDIPAEVGAPDEYRWWRSVMDFDARAAWARVRVPVLVVKGGKDPMSPAEPAQANIVGALRQGGNDQVTFLILPNADHQLLEWPLGASLPPPRFAPGYLDSVIRWMRAQTGLPR